MMEKYNYRKDPHQDIDHVFRDLLPAHGMVERPAQVELSHQMLDTMLNGTQVFWTRRHFNASKAASRRKQRNRPQKRNARSSSWQIAYTVPPAAPRCTEWVARTTGKTRCT